MGARADAHPWGEVSSFKMHYSKAFKRQFITGRPPLGEILYPPLPRVSTHPCPHPDITSSIATHPLSTLILQCRPSGSRTLRLIWPVSMSAGVSSVTACAGT